MKAFPMFIKTTDRRVVIVGGGEQAAQKARLILKTDARIVFAADALDPEIETLVQDGRAEWHNGPLTTGFFEGAAMVFVATGCFAIDVSAHAIAKAAHCAVNVVDQPHLCDITTPSLVDRDPVVIAIGTEGTAPVLSRQIKTQIEETLPRNLGGLAALAGRLRPSVAKHVERSRRRAFWAWVFSGQPRDMWTRGAEAHAATMIKDEIANRAATQVSDAGAVALIDAGPGAVGGDPELQSLRAVQRLQGADMIFYDRSGDAPILELARRDAERVFLGQSDTRLTPNWVQNRLMAEARRGARVVLVTACYEDHVAAAPQWQKMAEVSDITLEFLACAEPSPCFGQGRASAEIPGRLRAV
ncbi:MAG: NAD(P)-dependent oxidoreductase [Pseudomonadota bacterium]